MDCSQTFLSGSSAQINPSFPSWKKPIFRQITSFLVAPSLEEQRNQILCQIRGVRSHKIFTRYFSSTPLPTNLFILSFVSESYFPRTFETGDITCRGVFCFSRVWRISAVALLCGIISTAQAMLLWSGGSEIQSSPSRPDQTRPDQILLGTFGYFWVPLSTLGYLWVLLGTFWYLRVPLCTLGYLWVP